MIKICYFNNSYKNDGSKNTTVETTFDEYIKLVRAPDAKYIKTVELIRKAKSNKQLYNTLKRTKALHYYPSCTFDRKGCKLANVKALSGVMVFDLQNLEDTTPAKLKKWKHTLALHKSIGNGKGDYALYIYCDVLTLKNYRKNWELANMLLQKRFNISPDSSDATKDITRVRYLSYDPKCFYNLNAEPIKLAELSTFTDDQLRAIDQLLNNEPQWHRFGLALAVSKGEKGRTLYHQFSRVNESKYSEADVDKKYDRLLKESVKDKKGGITEATLLYMMQEMKLPIKTAKVIAEVDDSDKITIEKIVAYLNSQWVRNEINDRILNYNTGRETTIEAIWTHFQHEFHKPTISPSTIHTVARSEHMNTINPIRNFFALCADTYKKGNYIEQYVDTLPAADKQSALMFIKYWCIQAYEQAVEHKTNRSFLIFKGITENIGKSMALGWLCPVDGYLKTGPIVTDLKDTRIALAHNFIWNDDELKIFRASDINKIKALISTDVINERLPYGRSDETLKRLCSFCGSTNADEILPATEGNTRFLVVELVPGKNIKWNNYNSIDKKMFWGEVIRLSEEKWVAKNSIALNTLRAEVNKGQIINSRVREIIMEKLRSTAADKSRTVMRLHDVLNELDPMGDLHLAAKEFIIKDILLKEFGSGRTNGLLFGTSARGIGYACTIKK